MHRLPTCMHLDVCTGVVVGWPPAQQAHLVSSLWTAAYIAGTGASHACQWAGSLRTSWIRPQDPPAVRHCFVFSKGHPAGTFASTTILNKITALDHFCCFIYWQGAWCAWAVCDRAQCWSYASEVRWRCFCSLSSSNAAAWRASYLTWAEQITALSTPVSAYLSHSSQEATQGPVAACYSGCLCNVPRW